MATSSTERWEEGLLAADLQCPICMEFLCEPLLLGCGHSFCRLCLLKSTQLAPDGRRCPECRAQIELKDPSRHPVDAVLDSKIRIVVPPDVLSKKIELRKAELEEFLDRVQQAFPIFFMRGAASKVGELVALHLFEPRYKILIRRAWERNRRFICTQASPREGDTGLVVEIEEAKFLADGRANIRGRGVQVVTLKRVWIEEITNGLFYAEISEALLRTSSSVSIRASNSASLDMEADDPVMSTRSVAQAQAKLREAIRQGAPTYNRGDHKGCFDLYHDAAIQLLEDEVSENDMMAILLRRGLKKADTASRRRDWSAAAWAMRHAFDDALELRPSAQNSRSNNIAVDIIGVQTTEDVELPMFVLRPGVAVDQRVSLTLFEPRYRILAQEASRSANRFFMYASDSPSAGSRITLVHLDACEWDANGNAHIRGRGVSSVPLLSVRTDMAKGGLLYGSCTLPASLSRRSVDVAQGSPKCCVVQ